MLTSTSHLKALTLVLMNYFRVIFMPFCAAITGTEEVDMVDYEI